MKTRVVVLGAGFGGLELTSMLSDAFGDGIDVVLIDKSDVFVFGFSKLDVMFGRTVPDAVRHPYRDLVKPGVRFVQATIRSIDPAARRVETDAVRAEKNSPATDKGRVLQPNGRNPTARAISKDRSLQRIGDVSISRVVEHHIVWNRRKVRSGRDRRNIGQRRAVS